MSSYHGAFVSTEHDCFIKANVSFDIDDRITLIKVIQEKNACPVGDDFIRAESYLEIKTLSLEKNTFAKVAITGIIELNSGRKTFHESHAMPIALQRSHDQLVLVVSYNDIFPFNQLGKEVNDKLVFILSRDR
ncbi:hypothetical protein GWD52_20050 [Enterobacteriaceae bacterium 4M9]|nr:hypothetical protein [Enterobacteriaceae bacterium 4M9]